MPYIMGIDQGGTKTDIVIARETGEIIGYGNDRDWTPVTGERREVRMKRIRHAAENAVRNAGIPLGEVSAVSASCNGADWPFEYKIGERNIRSTLGLTNVTLYNDCIGALRGGTEINGQDCAVICLGTGANCAVFNREGERHIYAYYMKDAHQGAGAIGRALFQMVFDAEAGIAPPTRLTTLLLEETGYATVDDLLMAVTTGRREGDTRWVPSYKAYSPLLFRAVREGDGVARDYIRRFCRELAHYVIAAARKLSMEEREITLVLSGGVAKSGSILVDLLEEHLRESLPGIRCLNAHHEPVVGALLLEYDRIYPEGIPAAVGEALERCCQQMGLIRPATMQQDEPLS